MIQPQISYSFSYYTSGGKWHTKIVVGTTTLTGDGFYSMSKVVDTILKHFPEYDEEVELVYKGK